MNETIKTLLNRRSIRKFKSDAVSKKLIAQVAEAGIYAASGMGKQAATVVAITNKGLRDRISEMNRKIGGWDEGFDPFYGAPVILLVLAKKEIPTYLYDGSLAMGNLMNAAYSLGLGSIWIHPHERRLQPRARQHLDSPRQGRSRKRRGQGNSQVTGPER